MIRTNTITGIEMRDINRSAILDYIRRKGPASRSIIAREVALSLPTVMHIVDELIEECLVVPTGLKEYSGGRRRPLLELNSKGNVIVGVDLGGTSIYGAVTDLSGTLLVEKKSANQPVSAEDSYSRLVSLCKSLIKNDQIADKRILGIGVGTQGVTNHQDGVVLWDPIQNWHDYPLKQKLSLEFGLPVVVDNDVNLAALGEFWFGAGQNTLNMVLITVGTGIGAGIIIDGSLYRGSHHLSGEVGYFAPSKEYLGRHLENFGALESLASLPAITEQARRLNQAGLTNNGSTNLTPKDIFQAMLAKEEWACKIIDEMVNYLSIAVLNVSALIDPDLIVLRSGLDINTDLLIEPILTRIEGLVPIKPRLTASQLGYKATALGTIVEVLHNTTNFYMIKKLK